VERIIVFAKGKLVEIGIVVELQYAKLAQDALHPQQLHVLHLHIQHGHLQFVLLQEFKQEQ
jgi:hypothetical protein